MKGYITTVVVALFVVLACNNKESPKPEADSTARSADSVAKKKTIVFFGNSLTAGYGLSPSEAFPALIQKKNRFTRAALPGDQCRCEWRNLHWWQWKN